MVMPEDRGTHEADFRAESFVVKIWLEETIEEAGRATWRGHITHVPSGMRKYIQDLNALAAFVAPYLEAMGVELDARGHSASKGDDA